MNKPRVRPSKTAAFRLVAFAGALIIFTLAYWLGNRYQSPAALGDLQALLISPARALPEFSLRQDNRDRPFAETVDDWLLLLAGGVDDTYIHTLTSAHNRLAADAKLQQRFRIWLLQPHAGPLPDFFQVKTLQEDQRQQLYATLKLRADEQLLFLVNPDGLLQAVFTDIKSPATIAADFQAIISHYTP
jgi:hypothetical protein